MNFKPVETLYDIYQIRQFSELEHLHFKTAQILMQRGIDTDEKFKKFTSPTLDDLKDPFLLSNMKECHQRIERAVQNDESILIFGDYDVDGISAVSILYKFLRDKVSNLNYFLPNRYEDGYGLTLESAKKVISLFHPNLIITVDCGISCAVEVDYIKSLGIDIIITDHHEIPDVVPNTIVVDPKLPNQKYGFSALCGAGVALKIVQSFVGATNLLEYLPICAIATVSDIVPLVDENRAIVKLGLLHQDKLPDGVKMLVKSLKLKDINSQAISFKIAPRLNATGRMGNAYHSLNLYISNDAKVLKNSLCQVEQLNIKRQNLSQNIYDECSKIISAQKLYRNKAIILANKSWDSGLLGIACARLVEDYFRPVFLFSDVNGELKGSVRSVEGINIHTVLSCCSEYLDTFGGHQMAAGLSLKREHFETFKAQVQNYLRNNTTEKCYAQTRVYDVSIKPEEVNLQLAKELQLLEPFGCENPYPLFLLTYDSCTCKKLPNFDAHISISLPNGLKFVSFNSSEYIDDYQYAQTKQSIVELQINEFQGKQSIRGIVKRTAFLGYSKALENVAMGRILKQYLPQQKYEKPITFFAEQDAKSLLDDLLQAPSGTAVIIYNLETYKKFKTIIESYNISHFVGGSQSKLEENCVVFALDTIDGVKKYKNLVFLDVLQKSNFLIGFDGDVYAIKNMPSKLEHLDMSRGKFASIYRALSSALKQKSHYGTELELYHDVKRQNPSISNFSYAQFVACLHTFLEIGVIKQKMQQDISYQIDASKKTSLENSNFYVSLSFVNKLI